MKRTELKHQAIVDAAIALFLEQGYGKTRVDDIAAKAEVSKRTVYKHFENKEALFFHILESMMLLFDEHGVVVDEDSDFSEQLVQLLLGKINMLCNPDLINISKIVLAATLNNDVDLSEVQNKLNKPEGALLVFLQKALKEGLLKAESAEELESWLVATIKGRLFWPQLLQYRSAPSDAEKYDLAKQLSRLFLYEFAG
ncbi:TetR/AcrR family transcriptional regulator [Agaribacterium sp. ZY112]|uniref:TetR/AcrR family transcriptional regulator n=1 Tax=Agaribacterium sp. ZY112 TaxID=3233574 RepID=UPI0035268737